MLLEYAYEIETILECYDDGEVHYIERGTVDSFSAAVAAMGDDWECDWQWNEDDDCYDFKVWRYGCNDPDAETRLKLIGE